MVWGKARALTFECLDCSWRKTSPPAGDVLMHGLTYFEQCPVCNGKNLLCRESTDVEQLVERLMPWRRER
jgi:hypothetical protein